MIKEKYKQWLLSHQMGGITTMNIHLRYAQYDERVEKKSGT